MPIKDHYVHLDGLRGVASSFVVLHHAWQAAIGVGALSGVLGSLFNWLLYGHLAVDVFIVISGFCLTLPLVRSGTLVAPNARRFFMGRARRILPPYFAMLAIAIALAIVARLLFGSRSGLPFEARHVVVNVLLLQDIFPELNIFNMASWSVAVETHIYLLFPLLVAICIFGRIPTLVGIATIASYGATLALQYFDPYRDLSKSCIWYVALFAMGMGAAIRLRDSSGGNAKKYYSGVISIVFALISIILIQFFPITAAGEAELFRTGLPYIDGAVGVSAAAFLLWTTRSVDAGVSSWSIRLLSSKPIVFVGTFAYSLYLVHFPLFQYMKQGLVRAVHLETGWAMAMIFMGIGVPVALLSAYVFYRLFERPFLTKQQSKAAGRPLQATV